MVAGFPRDPRDPRDPIVGSLADHRCHVRAGYFSSTYNGSNNPLKRVCILVTSVRAQSRPPDPLPTPS
eukprot:1635745-Pyramimonas_sp.AAC.1